MLPVLSVFLALDLLLPFLLAPSCEGYRHGTQVMSVLGNEKAPLHRIYNLWLIILGIAILWGCVPICAAVAESGREIAVALIFSMGVYALGACILSGIFPVGETKKMETLAAKIHGFGSAIGFLALAFAPLLAGCYFFQAVKPLLGVISLICFVLAVLFFVLFVMADKPRFQGTVVALEGLWQRLSLLCMYLPVAILCLAGR